VPLAVAVAVAVARAVGTAKLVKTATAHSSASARFGPVRASLMSVPLALPVARRSATGRGDNIDETKSLEPATEQKRTGVLKVTADTVLYCHTARHLMPLRATQAASGSAGAGSVGVEATRRAAAPVRPAPVPSGHYVVLPRQCSTAAGSGTRLPRQYSSGTAVLVPRHYQCSRRSRHGTAVPAAAATALALAVLLCRCHWQTSVQYSMYCRYCKGIEVKGGTATASDSGRAFQLSSLPVPPCRRRCRRGCRATAHSADI
jgi:hypothetical protein